MSKIPFKIKTNKPTKRWLTLDATEDGSPNVRLWGIKPVKDDESDFHQSTDYGYLDAFDVDCELIKTVEKALDVSIEPGTCIELSISVSRFETADERIKRAIRSKDTKLKNAVLKEQTEKGR